MYLSHIQMFIIYLLVYCTNAFHGWNINNDQVASLQLYLFSVFGASLRHKRHLDRMYDFYDFWYLYCAYK